LTNSGFFSPNRGGFRAVNSDFGLHGGIASVFHEVGCATAQETTNVSRFLSTERLGFCLDVVLDGRVCPRISVRSPTIGSDQPRIGRETEFVDKFESQDALCSADRMEELK
jgi:hypothetical protein